MLFTTKPIIFHKRRKWQVQLSCRLEDDVRRQFHIFHSSREFLLMNLWTLETRRGENNREIMIISTKPERLRRSKLVPTVESTSSTRPSSDATVFFLLQWLPRQLIYSLTHGFSTHSFFSLNVNGLHTPTPIPITRHHISFWLKGRIVVNGSTES